MSRIRIVYHPAAQGMPQYPNFPAIDQHADSVRYLVGAYYVDAIGGTPTLDEVIAFINPPGVLTTPTIEDLQAAQAAPPTQKAK